MKIALLGDTAFFGRFDLDKNSDVLAHLADVRRYLRGHDVVVVNLETPLCGDRKAKGAKSAHIRSPEANIEVLKFLGVTHATLANNHMGDFGWAGYEDTKRLLEEAGIEWFGCEGRQAYIETEDTRVALLGYCAFNTNPLMISTRQHKGINPLDIDQILQDMDENTKGGFLNILAIHSGQEHVPMPSLTDIRLARGLARRFDYVYYGHHPHIIQGSEMVGKSPIFYSLGNFLFDDVYTYRDSDKPLVKLSEANKIGLIATIEVFGGEVTGWHVTPTYISSGRVLVAADAPAIDLQKINGYLHEAESEGYSDRRNAIILEYITARKSVRNLKWYLQRLDLNSINIILRARSNAKQQAALVDAKLSKLN